MWWPSTIERSIEAVDLAPFLSDQDKQDIFYNNAARFLQLSEEAIAKHHEIAGG
jgi:predicted TIM-barrel fold metal-dependent hydrolase